MPSMRCIQSKITFLASRNSFGCVTARMVTVKFDLSAYPCQLKWSMQHRVRSDTYNTNLHNRLRVASEASDRFSQYIPL
jgi:hypothetical protein